MSHLFMTMLNMSLTASYVALVIIAIRYILAKCHVPKIYAYVLWIVVLFRLTIPISFESIFSLIPGKGRVTNIISTDRAFSGKSSIDSEMAIVDPAQNDSSPLGALPSEEMSELSPVQLLLDVGMYVWLLGIFALIVYAVISFIRLKRRLTFATQKQDNIFETDQIQSPFVFGFIKPRIYLPLSLPEPDMKIGRA